MYAVLRIRIRIDPHQNNKLNPDPQQFADDKPKFMEYEPI
jgi:hypothetical protein